jgi:hypothetical protein
MLDAASIDPWCTRLVSLPPLDFIAHKQRDCEAVPRGNKSE